MVERNCKRDNFLFICIAFLRHTCSENHTRTDSFTSETTNEEVDYGSFDIDAIPHTDSDHAWSTHENDSQD